MFAYVVGVALESITGLNRLDPLATPDPVKLHRWTTVMLVVISLFVLVPVSFSILAYVGFMKVDTWRLHLIWMCGSAIACIFGSRVYLARQHKDSTGEPFAGYKFVILVVPWLLAVGFFKGLTDAEVLKERTSEAPITRITLSEWPPVEGQTIFLLEKYVVFLKHNERAVSAIPTSLIRLIEELPHVKTETKP